MDRAAVPSAANRRRRTPLPSMKWQKTRSPFAFSSTPPCDRPCIVDEGRKVDGDRFATPQRKIGVLLLNKALVKIGKATELLGVSVQTLRNGRTPVSWFQIGAAKAACATTTWAKTLGRLKFHCVGIALNQFPALIRSERRRDLPGLASDAPHLRTDHVSVKTAHSKMRWH